MLIKLKNQINEINKIYSKVQTFCINNNISDTKRHDIILILDEVITNIINYAYPDGHEHIFILDLKRKFNSVYIKLIDNGIPFDPLTKINPDINLSLEDRQIGGLGIFIIKQLSEAIEYSRTDGKNKLEIKIVICDKEKK